MCKGKGFFLMSETTSGDVSVMFVVGLLIGAFAGFLAAMFVVGYNDGYHQTEHKKQLVELGVGYYDTRTGGFHTKACTK